MVSVDREASGGVPGVVRSSGGGGQGGGVGRLVGWEGRGSMMDGFHLWAHAHPGMVVARLQPTNGRGLNVSDLGLLP